MRVGPPIGIREDADPDDTVGMSQGVARSPPRAAPNGRERGMAHSATAGKYCSRLVEASESLGRSLTV